MKIIIPMSGFGERFRNAGYEVPKPLIQVNKFKIIEHVVKMFSDDDEFIFICNKDHLSNNKWGLEKILRNTCSKFNILSIEPHKLGPVYAVLKAKHLINPSEPVVVNYCDFTCYWDWEKFKKKVLETQFIGAIPAYKGFHPHSLGVTNYAYIRERDQIFIDIKEKEPFTDNRMNEYASSGTYYFRTGKILIESFEETIKRDLNVNGEYYVSLAYKIISEKYKNIYIYPIEHFMQWGTPQDLKEYQYWDRTFEKFVQNNNNFEISNKKVNGSLIIPMAGLGNRFLREGYKRTKPLIEVSGKSMVLQAINDLPNFEQKVFVLRKDMPEFDETIKLINTTYPNSFIKIVPHITEGQASSTLEGFKALKNKTKIAPVTISACDNGVIFNLDKFNNLMQDDEIDIFVWGAKGHANAIRNPNMYGWIDHKENGIIKKISVKKPINNDTNKPIIIGTFTFKKTSMLEKVLEKLIKEGIRVNGEYYLDSCINLAIDLGMKCKYFQVENYICWGTPNDLKTFEYWQSCFHKWKLHDYDLNFDKNVQKEKISSIKKRYNIK